tara:strand:+ start:5745 stop:5990 length:246 start_codon:yes stop_codon:yes gene_type:complete
VIAISYKIEKGIPYEDAQPHRKVYKRKSRFDILNQMEPNDSIVVSSKREAGLARAFAIRNGFKVKTKRIDTRKYRVWRNAD